MIWNLSVKNPLEAQYQDCVVKQVPVHKQLFEEWMS